MEEMLLAAPFGPSKMSVCQCACEGGGESTFESVSSLFTGLFLFVEGAQ